MNLIHHFLCPQSNLRLTVIINALARMFIHDKLQYLYGIGDELKTYSSLGNMCGPAKKPQSVVEWFS